MAIRLKNVHISGAHTGIKSNGPVDIDAENVTFDNVTVPYDIAGARTASIRGSRVKNDPKLGYPRSKGSRATVGWTRPNGPPLPVFCPSCKSIFASRNYNFGGAYFNAWNNEEPCPECGSEHAKLSEGLFDLAENAVRVLSAPDITYAMLHAVRDIGEALCKGEIDADGAVRQLECISPSIGQLARRALSFGNAAILFCSAVAGIVALYYSHQQVQLGREQLRLQQEANESSDKMLERILDTLSKLRFDSKGMRDVSPGDAGAARQTQDRSLRANRGRVDTQSNAPPGTPDSSPSTAD